MVSVIGSDNDEELSVPHVFGRLVFGRLVFGRLVSHWKNRQFFVDSVSDVDE